MIHVIDMCALGCQGKHCTTRQGGIQLAAQQYANRIRCFGPLFTERRRYKEIICATIL